MKIITAPHSTLRTKAKPVKRIDKKLFELIKGLENTLAPKGHPKGVGLAAPQVNKKWRLFATHLTKEDGIKPIEMPGLTRVFINPRLIKYPKKLSLGPNQDEPTIEGCLSIKNIYGPVPRYPWAEFAWQEIENDKLVEKKARFEDFAARVMQHELDHLDGILFTDYSLEYDLPVYAEDKATQKFIEITNREILNTF